MFKSQPSRSDALKKQIADYEAILPNHAAILKPAIDSMRRELEFLGKKHKDASNTEALQSNQSGYSPK